MTRRPVGKSVESRLAAVERGIKSLQASDAAIITIIKDMQEGFAHMENRLEQGYNHVDGFMKLHETLDIEFRVIKDSAKDSQPVLFPHFVSLAMSGS